MDDLSHSTASRNNKYLNTLSPRPPRLNVRSKTRLVLLEYSIGTSLNNPVHVVSFIVSETILHTNADKFLK